MTFAIGVLCGGAAGLLAGLTFGSRVGFMVSRAIFRRAAKTLERQYDRDTDRFKHELIAHASFDQYKANQPRPRIAINFGDSGLSPDEMATIIDYLKGKTQVELEYDPLVGRKATNE